MAAELLIVGQGLAGTWLGWECERAGIAFEIADAGGAPSASRISAGLINPITGQRFVKTWSVDERRDEVRASYAELEAGLGVQVWHDVRIWREFRDEAERRRFAAKEGAGRLRPWVREASDAGFWIDGAARVDVPSLLDAAQARWVAAGRWRAERVDVERAASDYALVVDCTGAAARSVESWAGVPWETSAGEILEIRTAGLRPDVVRSRGHWLVASDARTAKAGATHRPRAERAEPTATGRGELEASVRELLGGAEFQTVGHAAAVRATLPDRRPVLGRHPRNERLAVFAGLGGKGAWFAPLLARLFVAHWRRGGPLPDSLRVERFL